jgi:hypothetical protein
MLNFFDAADATRKIQPLANSASIAKLSDVKCLFMLTDSTIMNKLKSLCIHTVFLAAKAFVKT